MAAVGTPVSLTAGLRPFNPFRDLPGVTALLATVFGPELSLESRSTARLVRWMKRYPSIGWIWLGFDAWFDGSLSGFVWLDGGRVTGNANIAPVGSGSRWILSNVAVTELQRGRGIGRALVEACLQEAWARGAERVLLQVWERNQAALHLYRSLHFEELGRFTRLSLAAARSTAFGRPAYRGDLKWVNMRAGDSHVLAELARAMVSSPARKVRPSPMVPFRSSLTDRVARYLPGLEGRLAARRRVLLRGPSPVAAIAAVPTSDELVRATILAAPGAANEIGDAIVDELGRLSARHAVGLIADVPGSLDRLQASMLAWGWEAHDCLLQMACDRPAVTG